MHECYIFECRDTDTYSIQKGIAKILGKYVDLFPEKKDALILLKPNLNSDMCGLTGNTTDLRVLVAVIKFLKDKKYKNIVIGDGTNSGFLTMGINVISRLKIDKLAENFKCEAVDFNKASYKEISFDDKTKTKIKIAKACFDADFFINIPKMKTHAEAGISVCLKNMLGCVVGQDKQKIHDDLYRNILRLNEHLKPNMHIVDGLIAMEGTGPSKGIPRKTDLILAGTDPYLIDLICARLMGFDCREIPYLKLAEREGVITSYHHEFANSISKKKSQRFERPKTNILAKFINHPKYRKYFMKLRYSPGFYDLFSSELISKIFFISGIRQDMYIKNDGTIRNISVDKEKCVGCDTCKSYCPLNVKIEDTNNECIKCLYCFFVCPEKAIKFEGNRGYVSYQMRYYGKHIRNMIEEPKHWRK
jgi:uncharacterized protein (DUF362 family)/ferredoxin